MKTIDSSKRKSRWALGLVPMMIVGWLGVTVSPVGADPWVNGDVIAAVSDGQYQSFTSGGSLEHLIQAGTQGRPDGGFTTGCAFNPAGFPAVTQNLYTTLWAEKAIGVVPDGATHTPTALIDTTLSGGTGHPETIAFDTDGNFFVGLVDGAGPNLLKYSKAHALMGSWTLPIGADMRGVDSIDLDNDQVTVYWTSEDPTIRSFNTQTGTPGADFASFPGRRLYNVRLLQPGNGFAPNGTGVMAVADTTEIKILSASGAVVNTYGESLAATTGFGNGWFSVSVDSSGTQLLSGDFYGGRVVKFNANDTVAQTYSTGKGPFFVNGVCARGEVTRAVVPTPDVGFFVVGDREAGYPFGPMGKTVTFHEQNWNSIHDNTTTMVSGGVPKNSSFKGFAENANLTTNPCGGNFTSKGGSAGAGAIQVGQRIAIIVTNQVVDPPGGDIQGQGNVISIILVTVTEYTGGGVPVGKGTVTQVICTT
jgi:hypothetical protein